MAFTVFGFHNSLLTGRIYRRLLHFAIATYTLLYYYYYYLYYYYYDN